MKYILKTSWLNTQDEFDYFFWTGLTSKDTMVKVTKEQYEKSELPELKTVGYREWV